jgi:hypothetical protein
MSASSSCGKFHQHFMWAFSYKSFACSFLYLHFMFGFLWRKCAHKMLVKLTPGTFSIRPYISTASHGSQIFGITSNIEEIKTKRGKFYQHLMSIFCTDFIAPQKIKSKLKAQRSCLFDFVRESC